MQSRRAGCMPPEKPPSGRLRASVRLTSSSNSSMRRAPLPVHRALLAAARYSKKLHRVQIGIDAEVLRQITENGTKCIGALAMSTPFQSTRPSVALVIVARMRISVVLPAPLGPSRPSTPGFNSRLKLRRATTPLRYRLVTFSMASCTGSPNSESE